MLSYEVILQRTVLCLVVLNIVDVYIYCSEDRDQTTSRPNTLMDEADDIQRQLDNEARERLRYGQPKTVWVFNFPPGKFPLITPAPPKYRFNTTFQIMFTRNRKRRESKNSANITDWSYNDQLVWELTFPSCKGNAQSPIDVPIRGLVTTKGARTMKFNNYDVTPISLNLAYDKKRVTLTGEWPKNKRPYLYGGAVHSRRYLFHSLSVLYPSEHTIATLTYPLETQTLHISADYCTFDEAVRSFDPQAFLGVVNLYRYHQDSQPGLKTILETVVEVQGIMDNISISPRPLSHFSPSFNEYACYQGSLTVPPCTESVMWLIRGNTLPISRCVANTFKDLLSSHNPQAPHVRRTQRINDRKIYLFKQDKRVKGLLND